MGDNCVRHISEITIELRPFEFMKYKINTQICLSTLNTVFLNQTL